MLAPCVPDWGVFKESNLVGLAKHGLGQTHESHESRGLLRPMLGWSRWCPAACPIRETRRLSASGRRELSGVCRRLTRHVAARSLMEQGAYQLRTGAQRAISAGRGRAWWLPPARGAGNCKICRANGYGAFYTGESFVGKTDW